MPSNERTEETNLEKRIEKEKEAANPDYGLIRGWEDELTKVRDRIKEAHKGQASPPWPFN